MISITKTQFIPKSSGIYKTRLKKRKLISLYFFCRKKGVILPYSDMVRLLRKIKSQNPIILSSDNEDDEQKKFIDLLIEYWYGKNIEKNTINLNTALTLLNVE